MFFVTGFPQGQLSCVHGGLFLKEFSSRSICRRGYLFALFCIASATAIFLFGRDFFDKGQWALLYLLIITFIATVSGFKPALLAAICSFLAWNFFFLPPYGTFWINDPKDWLFLFVFLFVGVAMGYQTGQLRKREASAVAREKEMALLNRLTIGMVSEPASISMVRSLLKEIQKVMNVSNVALFFCDGQGSNLREVRTDPDSKAVAPYVNACTRWVFQNRKVLAVPDPNERGKNQTVSDVGESSAPSSIAPGASDLEMFIPLSTSERIEGVLHVGEKNDRKYFSRHDLRLLASVASVAAGYLERQRLQGAASLAETLKEADKMKSALVSSVSHELKTPLAAITATITSLLEEDIDLAHEEINIELQSVRMNLQRLSGSIESLLDLSRLEADAWQPKREWNDLREMLGTVLSRFSKEQVERFRLEFPEQTPLVFVDYQQWCRLMYHLIENALSYGSGEKGIVIGAAVSGPNLRIWVQDSGAGIQKEEEKRIFEKFYRGKAAESVPGGTGLGLAVAQEIVNAHGGRIFHERPKEKGARFVIELPAQFSREV